MRCYGIRSPLVALHAITASACAAQIVNGDCGGVQVIGEHCPGLVDQGERKRDAFKCRCHFLPPPRELRPLWRYLQDTASVR